MNPAPNLDLLIDQLPEPELWALLQEVAAAETDIADQTVRRLDDRMQGFLFLHDHVSNREARIDFARSPAHMAYLRDAAGSRNVWMSDVEFNALVDQDDSLTLACFARSEQMKPHHLAYIEYKLAAHPHGHELLASAYDASITLIKALEVQGNTREMALFRLAKAAVDGCPRAGQFVEHQLPGSDLPSTSDPRALWRAYRNLEALDERTIRELLEVPERSTVRPVMTSGRAGRSLH